MVKELNYIYLLQDKQYYGSNVFKIGMTRRKNLTRFNEYEKGSQLLLQKCCEDCVAMEKIIIGIFKNMFKLVRGREWFEGDYKYMMSIIETVIQNEKTKKIKSNNKKCKKNFLYKKLKILKKTNNIIKSNTQTTIIKKSNNEIHEEIKLEETTINLINNLDNDTLFNGFLKINCPNFLKIKKGIYYIFNETNKLYENKDAEYSSHYLSLNVTTFMKKHSQYFVDKLYDKLYNRYTNNMKRIILNLLNHELTDNFNTRKGHIPITNNKILNLDNLEIRERTNDDYFTFEMPVNYNSLHYNENEIKTFINTLFNNDATLIQNVLNLCKTIMYGINLKYIFVFYGDECNGKTIFVNSLKYIYAKYCYSINSNSSSKFKKDEFQRIVILNESYFVNITEKQIIDEVMNSEVPLLLCTKHFPKFDKTEKSMLDRIIPIPFLNSFELNENFKNKMKPLYDDLFTYIVKYGTITTTFEKCNSMQLCSDIQISEFDSFVSYFNENYKITKSKNNYVLSSEIKLNYKIWCEQNCIVNNIKSVTQYGKALKLCGVNWKTEVRDKNRIYFYLQKKNNIE